jgi:outer membrane lipoprotein-sorting protein
MVCLMRLLFLPLLLAGTMLTASAQELSDILEEHFKASGQEKLQKVETIIATGRNVYSLAGFESRFRIYQSKPDKLRVEGDYQGSKVVQTYDGTTGWKYAPTMGIPEPTEIKGQELENLLSQVQFESPLWDYQTRGASLAIGSPLDGVQADHLVLTTRDGAEQHYFIDRQTHLITEIKSRQLMGGSETEIEVLMKDYKPVKGIPVAHQVITKMNGQVVTTIYFEKVEFNRTIDQNLFNKPLKE